MENNNRQQGNRGQQYNAPQFNGMSQQNSGNQPNNMSQQSYGIKDYGGLPVVFDMETITKMNDNYRAALWTGNYMQIVLMSIEPGDDIGVEMHSDLDQFVRIEEGDGLVQMGTSQDNLSFSQTIEDDDAIVIPAGLWHNISNTGDVPLKLYTIYAPPNHPFGVVHRTKAEADAAEQAED